MTNQHVNVVIIGAGTAGLNARREALKHGASSVLLVENGPYGTMCARVGCMPSKLLIHPAHVAHEAALAASAGVHAEIRIDDAELLGRVRRERDRFVGFVVESTENIPEDQRLRGTAKFLDNHTLDVDGTQITFDQAVIATGSKNRVPPQFEEVLRNFPDRILTNDNIFEIEQLPKKLAVFGMGVVGLELGQALTYLGVETHFFGRHRRFCGTTDPAVVNTIKNILDEDLNVHWNTTVKSVEGFNGGVKVTWTTESGETRSETFEKLLLAAGREPNVKSLNLSATSVPLDDAGFPQVDLQTGQAGDTNFFFAGDVTGERLLLHEAADEGRQAGANAARFPEVHARARRTPLMVTFTNPNIAVVGKGYSELELGSYEAGEVSYYDQGRSRVMQKNRGILRLYGCKETGRLLGAEGVAPSLEHMAHLLAWSIQAGLTVKELLRMPFYHPVTEEGVRTALQDLERKLRHL